MTGPQSSCTPLACEPKFPKACGELVDGPGEGSAIGICVRFRHILDIGSTSIPTPLEAGLGTPFGGVAKRIKD